MFNFDSKLLIAFFFPLYFCNSFTLYVNMERESWLVDVLELEDKIPGSI